MKKATTVFIAAAVLATAGCNSFPFGTCTTDYIDALLPGTVSLDGDPVATQLSNRIARTNIIESFDALQSIIDDASGSSAVIAFDVQNFSANVGPAVGLSVRLRMPATTGRVYTVSRAFDGGGWGIADLPAGVDVEVGIRVGELRARTVAGTITVLDPTPLTLRIDLDAVADDGRTLHVDGDLAFELVTEEVSCS